MRATRSRIARIVGWSCAGALLFTGCAGEVKPPDLDGEAGQAVVLELDQPHTDQLFCEEGDCADWYRFRLSERGKLRIELTATDMDGRPLGLELADGRAEPLDEVAASGGVANLERPAEPGFYMLRVGSDDKSKRALPYQLTAYFEAEPPPPPPPRPARKMEPRFRVVVGAVLEVEGSGESEAVLIDRGESDGIATGQHGRLIDQDRVIATIEVVASYPEGSRIRLHGALGAPITVHTRAEIDVPVSGAE